MGDVRIDVVSDPASCRVVEDIQRHAWGMSDRQVVPAEQIRAAVHRGGLLLLASEEGRPVGFCYGFVGLDDGTPVLCSHMLAVVPDVRSRGVGRALKLAQRRHAAERGFNTITWTFDPLQARNAYLNLHRLGATASRYHVDHYGPMDDAINAGLPTDRLVAEWPVTGDSTADSHDTTDGDGTVDPPAARDAVPWLLAPASGTSSARPSDIERSALNAATALVAVPADIDALRQRDPDSGPVWRTALRTAFAAAFEADMTAVDLVREPVSGCHAYVLEHTP